ncbi:MAG: metallophosphoesterase family protein [Chloroflexia bacterium]
MGGDVATGPWPRETVDRLASLGSRARFIRGNSDREVVARFDLGEGLDWQYPDDAVERVTAWTARRLAREQRDFLATFVEQLTVEIVGLGSVLFCHGSPRSDEEIITRATSPDRMSSMLSGVTKDVVVCGHTHVQFDRVAGGQRVVNAGSVGMPYEHRRGAYWALLGPDVRLQRTEYDFERAAQRVHNRVPRGSGVREGLAGGPWKCACRGDDGVLRAAGRGTRSERPAVRGGTRSACRRPQAKSSFHPDCESSTMGPRLNTITGWRLGVL